jgi:hypothetical protein
LAAKIITNALIEMKIKYPKSPPHHKDIKI